MNMPTNIHETSSQKKEALDAMKYEIANELGVSLKEYPAWSGVIFSRLMRYFLLACQV
jgi:hypothetical protein